MKWWMAAVACAVTIGLAGCSQDVPFAAGTPAAAFDDAECPTAIGEARDVEPSVAPDGRLVAAHPLPDRALICEYSDLFGRRVRRDRTLVQQIRVDERDAARLATAAARIDVGIPPGTVSCPNDTESAVVIVLGYPHRPSVALWWHSSGCQSVDNGTVEGVEGANESFFRFQAVFAAVARDADG